MAPRIDIVWEMSTESDYKYPVWVVNGGAWPMWVEVSDEGLSSESTADGMAPTPKGPASPSTAAKPHPDWHCEYPALMSNIS